MARPEALLVVPVTPLARGNGLAMRAGMLLEGLARDHAVRVVVVPVFGGAGPPDELTRSHAAALTVLELPAAAEAVASRLADPVSRARLQRLHPVPDPAARLGAATATAVAAHAAGCRAVLVMRLYLAPVLDAVLAADARPPVVIDLDDLDAERERQLGDEEQAAAYERMGAEYLPRVDLALTASERDRERVVGAAAVVPNGVRVPAHHTRGPAEHDLLLVGNLGYSPNAQAAGWLCREVLPLLPDATAAVVGSSPPPEVRALASEPRVTVAADVPDVAPWYAAARVATAPLHAGAGTRTKVLEAWAHGLPVVATTLGAEGLDVDGAALVADEPAAFAAACRRVLADPALAARLADAGRRRVLERGTAGHGAAVLADLVATMVRP